MEGSTFTSEEPWAGPLHGGGGLCMGAGAEDRRENWANQSAGVTARQMARVAAGFF